MVDRRPGDQDAHVAVAEVRTAIQFLAKGIDRLETSVERLEQTVREDFASTGDLELLKMSVVQLREDVNRLSAEVGPKIDARLEQRLGVVDIQQKIDMKVVRWFIYAGIPAGIATVAYWLWEGLKAYARWQASGGPKSP